MGGMIKNGWWIINSPSRCSSRHPASGSANSNGQSLEVGKSHPQAQNAYQSSHSRQPDGNRRKELP